MKANARICCPLSYVFLSNTCLRRLTGIVILNEVKNLNRFIGYKRRDPSAEFILSLGEGPKDDIATTVFWEKEQCAISSAQEWRKQSVGKLTVKGFRFTSVSSTLMKEQQSRELR
jgi:hypothetical protein